jgi:hypothetical protein
MLEFRGDFKAVANKKKTYAPEDLTDLWTFVQKELNLG